MSPSVEPFNEAKYKALMDGLKCSETKLSDALINKDFRIDSAFYTTKIQKNDALNYVPIGECLISSQYGLSIDMNDVKDGYPIFRMNEIHHMLCDLDTAKYANISKAEFEKFKLNDKDVLFNRTNSYEWVGRTGIYYDSEKAQTFASYMVRFVPDSRKLLPEYLTAFLSSCYGVMDIKRRSRQSINQTNVNPEEVKEVLIPLLNLNLQKNIAQCFERAHQSRILAQTLYKQAEHLLLIALDIPDFDATQKCFSIKTLGKSFSTSGRLDAEYYQPKYDEYISLLHTNDTVNTLCKIHDRGYKPIDSREYQYIELANVGTTGNISDVEYIIGKDLPSRARRKVKKGQVIISSVEGSLQSCALVTDEYDNALCSTGFYVLTSDFINSETLLVLFKSEPIQALMKQRCSGTILTAISKDELLSMPFPKIDDTVQKEIASKVQESFALRRQSEQLLENAKQAVELAIELGEEKAMEWLEGKNTEV